MALLPNVINDDTIRWAFSQAELSLSRLERNPLADGKRIIDLDLSTTETTVAHGLGRTPKGLLVIRKNAAQHVFESSPADEEHIFLKSDGTVTATVWVF
tara:strand:+ start:226 stop:522 length:297 start_codon:yes stop_codon:yes gene_type:complete